MKKIDYTLKTDKRIIARLKGNKKGPCVIVIAGIHGNEPAGVIALEQFIQELPTNDLCGEFIAILGHKEALLAKKRFINKDLNRLWNKEQVDKVRRMERKEISCLDELEQKDILDTLDDILTEEKNVIFLDLHTTSAEGPPFAFIEDKRPNKNLAENLCVPNIQGLEKKLENTFIHYVNVLGYMVVAYEAGQNECYSSVDNALAFLWITSKYLGILPNVDVSSYQNILQKATDKVPQSLAIKYHHGICDEDLFRMKPGYKTFQEIQKEEVLAWDKNGEVKAPISGRILFPLYQGQGNDGFFIVQ